MKNCKEFLGKPVISLYDGIVLGKSYGLAFARKLKKLEYILLASDTPARCEYLLKAKDITAADADAITVRHSDLAVNVLSSPLRVADNSPLGAPAYTVGGEYLGKVDCVEVDDRYNVGKISTDTGKLLDLALVATNNKGMVILQNADKPVSLAKPASRKVKILPSKAVVTAENDVGLPDKAIINFEFLLGRRVQQNILLPNGKLLVARGTYITTNVLALCRSYGKLLELTRYSQV